MSTTSGARTAYPFGAPEEEFADTKGVIRIRISKKNRQNNGQRCNQNPYFKEEQTTQWPKV